jgi:hypothetical protein
MKASNNGHTAMVQTLANFNASVHMMDMVRMIRLILVCVLGIINEIFNDCQMDGRHSCIRQRRIIWQ